MSVSQGENGGKGIVGKRESFRSSLGRELSQCHQAVPIKRRKVELGQIVENLDFLSKNFELAAF